MADWQTIASETQQNVLSSIPSRWRITHQRNQESRQDVSSIPRQSGLLTERQLQITESSVTQLLERLQARDISAVETLEAFAARTAIAHQLVNCLTEFFLEEGLQRAAALDAHLAQTGSVVGPLHGLPIALKDTYSVTGHATTFGYIARRNDVVDYDSAIPAILRDSGAVFYAKTAMPQAGMALETNSNLFGRVLNPFNSSLGAGGSSGGDGALVAMRGSPVTFSTDIGGSIRAPAAVNGLYGIRPTADRVPKSGMQSVEFGQIAVPVSCGPVGHSIDDIRLLTKLITTHPLTKMDVHGIPFPWTIPPPLAKPMTFGLMLSDGVVEPHPPVRRALQEAAAALRTAGHEVIDFTPTFDCWECSKTTASLTSCSLSSSYTPLTLSPFSSQFHLYWPTGAAEPKATIASSGEPIIPVFREILDTYKVPSQTGTEMLAHHRAMFSYKKNFHAAWLATQSHTSTNRPIDALLTPVLPAMAIPHDFNIWWGYCSLFNILNYPSIVLPFKQFKCTPQTDPPNSAYIPRTTNPFDAPNHKMYDPELSRNHPMTLQIVGRPFEDEVLIEVAAEADRVLNAGGGH